MLFEPIHPRRCYRRGAIEGVHDGLRRQRASDSNLDAEITHVSHDGRTGEPLPPDLTVPDGLWDIVVIHHAGTVQVLQTGLITKPVLLPVSARPAGHRPKASGLIRPS